MNALTRRSVLRGMLNGGAVTVGLPLLDCFLNDNGNALASGAPIPVRYATWFWGLGCDAKVFVPKTVGPNYDLPLEIASFEPVKQHVNVFSNATAYRDTMPALCHYTGWVINRTGTAPLNQTKRPGETIDVTVANAIGRTTRFKLLTATANGDPRLAMSWENQDSINNPVASPILLYQKLFGPDFQDPNASTFTPPVRVMARRSVLSGVMDDLKSVQARLGAEDKARLDEYFTSVRHLEHQFDQQLTKPEPIAACHVPSRPTGDISLAEDVVLQGRRHTMLSELLAMALACDQTRVVSLFYSESQAQTTKAGFDKTHHVDTHEERVDETIGYQPMASWFITRSMEAWVDYVSAFAKIKEGDGTLLDNLLITADTDQGWARNHTLDGLPALSAGRAGGKVKTGLHIDLKGGPSAQIGFTAMRVFGVDSSFWGTGSNRVTQPIGEMLV